MEKEILQIILNRSEDLGMYREKCARLEDALEALRERVMELERQLELADDMDAEIERVLGR